MKRFYKDVSVDGADGGWQVALDGRGLRTQAGGAPQLVPTREAAELLAQEWRTQGEEIDPRSFVFRDLADLAIDVVRADRDAAIVKLLSFAETDTLCYRADPGEPLYQRQQEMWEPLVAACEARYGIKLERVSGIMHRRPSAETLAALRARLESEDDFILAALITLASIAASLVVPLAVLDEGADPAALFAAANAEEDWQAELWGWDHEAETVRGLRLEAFESAAAFAAAVRR
ncbi:ATP12 family chaperone protein [Aurantiacibacter aquimixticola]|uniref:Molecular chaperone n=1 Tax=Aurantiacibacter aquimixticola TaxID=1958945 RepID=A0A419RTJ9_9SPHN|nr:ATP12 family protein [Aurantiacibacter aquimixticola]RJY09074.1 molecular chaperone [Aurantiacibacter aquimixticola]